MCLLLSRKRQQRARRGGRNSVDVGIPEQLTQVTGLLLKGVEAHEGVFTRLLERAELRQVRIHDLGQTYASLLLQHG